MTLHPERPTGHGTREFGRRNAIREYFLLFAASGLLALVTVSVWTFLEVRSLAPQPAFEDAAMLFRYATNLAHGHGITWNIGQAPSLTDGATDLGFVLALAPLVLAGFQVTVAAYILNWLAVFFLAGLIALMCKRYFQVPVVAVLLLIVLLFSGPVNRYIQSGFSPVLFGLLLTFITAAGLRQFRQAKSRRWSWLLLGAVAGCAGWWRPEGFVLSVLLFIAIATVAGFDREIYPNVSLTGFVYTLIGFVVVASAWVAFRLLYFSHLMPSSAVLKSGELRLGNAVDSLQFLTLCLLPLIAVVVVVSLVRPTRLWIAFLLLIAMSAIWIPVIMHLNWWDRMQWPIVPALALVFIAATSNRADDDAVTLPGLKVSAIAAVVLGLVVIAVLRTYSLTGAPYSQYEPHTPLSAALSEVDTSGLRIATSEAGLIPLAVSGEALDTYGYNDYVIASSDGSQVANELERLNPNMIVLAGPMPRTGISPESAGQCYGTDLTNYLGNRWMHMASTVEKYARDQGFKLERAFNIGSCVVFSIYLNADTPSSVREAVSHFRTTTPEFAVDSSN